MEYLILTLGLLPGFAWLIFYLKEDPHPEPKPLIFETFLAGSLITFIVLGAQTLFNSLAEPRGIAQYSLISFLILAGIEEFFKFIAARLVVDEHQADFEEPVDAMIYLVVAALGFATIENLAAVAKAENIIFETAINDFIMPPGYF